MLKILLIIANPTDTNPLRLGEDDRIINQRLGNSDLREKYELKTLSATRIDDVRQTLSTYKPHIVQFSGHGIDDGLFLEDDAGKKHLVGVEALANLFELFKESVECVILNACYSEETAEAINQHIPYVIGMRKPISDKAANKFTTGFYDGIAAGEPFERAFLYGRSAIETAGIEFENEVATPIIHTNAELIAATQPTPKKASNAPLEMYISYAPQDQELKNELVMHLTPLIRQKLIILSSDIVVGLEHAEEIKARLNSADIILLLMSPRFIFTQYDTEMERAMERHDEGKARVVPVILSPVSGYQKLSIAKLRATPQNTRPVAVPTYRDEGPINVTPVTSWANRDEALYTVAEDIRRLVENMWARRTNNAR